ncbi:MAG TPA: tRNA (adenosine(37)-N6)-dimethylallyltransferase MiaA [Candidatus Paceibacterota bacterium]|nr:tRNA (adenosine(37)-N6)-dimethylallyltransferase MiaA [Candidatus Paceibacterota bacterium]
MNKLLIILGPTASGKSNLAIKIAKLFNGEIISADSRQVYKEMNIGTAKPSKGNIRYHLLDVIEPDKRFSVAQYKELAYKAIKDIQNRNKLPILCGGTGLYISSIIEDWQFPKVPSQEKLRKELEKKSVEQLFKIYQKLDTEGAKSIDKKNKRRLIRAIEVCKANNKPFWQQRKSGKSLFNTLLIGIKLPKEQLRERIAKRTKKMIKMGLETEVKTLKDKYGWIPSLQTIGYQEWKEYFSDKLNKKEVQNLIELHTIQYSKRQMTWFKKMKNIQWIKNPEQAIKLTELFLK